MRKLLIFDCDGVLIDSEIIVNRIDSKMLTDFGYPISVEEYTKRFAGMDVKSVEKIICEDYRLDISQEALKKNDQTVYESLKKEAQPLMLPLLLNPILNDIDKCVASNSSKKYVCEMLRVTEQDFFPEDHVFTAEQVQKAKPAPDVYLFAASQMGYHPKDCLVIEDSPVGIDAALSAGMSVIGFLGGSHTHFDWYQERIQNKDVPIAHNVDKLSSMISQFLLKEGGRA